MSPARVRPSSREHGHSSPRRTPAAVRTIRLDNGLLLRSDVHTLFDLGYLSVNTRHELQVSPRLRQDWGNGQEAGRVINVPQVRANRPDRGAIEWHLDTIFLR